MAHAALRPVLERMPQRVQLHGSCTRYTPLVLQPLAAHRQWWCVCTLPMVFGSASCGCDCASFMCTARQVTVTHVKVNRQRHIVAMHIDAKEWTLALGYQPPRRVRCVKITYKGNLPGTTEHVEQKSALGFLLAGYEGAAMEIWPWVLSPSTLMRSCTMSSRRPCHHTCV